MNIKLVAIDIDGTLLNDDYEVSKRTEYAIKALHEKGIKVTLASGRGPKSCDRYLEQLHIREDAIVHNGGSIYDFKSQKAKSVIGFEVEQMIPFVEYCHEQKIQFDINTALDMYVEQLLPGSEEMYHLFNIQPIVLEDVRQITDKVVKFTLFGQNEQLDSALPQMLQRFPDYRIIRSGEYFIDIMHAQTTKAHALERLLMNLDIQTNQVLTIGNYYNDLEMIRMAGVGIAMGNAPVDVQQEADHVTGSNNEEGVALVLERLLTEPAFQT